MNRPNQPPPSPAKAPMPRWAKVTLAAILLLALALSGYAVHVAREQSAANTPAVESTRDAAAEIATRSRAADEISPLSNELRRDGYVDYGNGVGWRWLPDEDQPLCDYGKCAWVQLVAYQDCSRIYIEANILEDGTVIDWTNATGSALHEGQVGIYELSTGRGSSGNEIAVTTIRCG